MESFRSLVESTRNSSREAGVREDEWRRDSVLFLDDLKLLLRLGMLRAAMPKVVVIAGPNGAGKSTTAPAVLRNALKVNEFVNVVDRHIW